MTAPRSLLVGFDGCVLVPAAVAEEVAGPFREALAALRRDALPLSPAALDVATALEQAAIANRARRTVDAAVDAAVDGPLMGGKVGDVQHGDVASDEVVDLTRAAELRRCTRQAIWARIGRGTLPGRQDERGRWWIRLADLEVAE
jgi:hypothetical protein